MDWLVDNKDTILMIAAGVVAGGVGALRWIAPLTATDKDDKALHWLKRAGAWLGRFVTPKE
jgi:hypothetical protein